MSEKLRQAAQQALVLADALETAEISYTSMVKAADELRRLHAENEARCLELLEAFDDAPEQSEQEPVSHIGWLVRDADGRLDLLTELQIESSLSKYERLSKLYTAPQPAKREPPTDEEIDRAITELGLDYFANAALNRAVLRELCKRAHGIGDLK